MQCRVDETEQEATQARGHDGSATTHEAVAMTETKFVPANPGRPAPDAAASRAAIAAIGLDSAASIAAEIRQERDRQLRRRAAAMPRTEYAP
jgi:hypothetical protein